MDWRAFRKCKDVDPETFFPDAKEGTVAHEIQVAAARAVCFGCPVAVQCLQLGLNEQDGIFGGHTPTQRAHLRRQRAHATVA